MLGASVRAIRLGGRDPGGRLSRRLRPRPGPRGAGGSRGGSGRPIADAADWAVGRWASERVRAGIEASLERLGVHFDVWKTESSVHDEGWVERGVARLREAGKVYEADGATWFRSTDYGDDKDRVIYRIEWRADVLRGRHRLRHREVQPRLRPPDLHLGRRPPRHGGAAAERRRGDGLRPRRGRGAADGVGPLRARRRRGLDEQARRRIHHARRAARRDRRRRGALVLRVTGALVAASTSTSSSPRSSRTRTRSTTCSTPMRGSRRSCARPPRRAWSGADSVAGDAGRRARGRPGASAGATAGGRRGRRGRPRDPGRHRRSRPSSRPTFHAFYRDARVVDPAEPERSRARLALVEAAQITLANALGLLGISAPESM